MILIYIFFDLSFFFESLLTQASIWRPPAEEFGTLLKEVESILKNRPLVAAHDDVTVLSVIMVMAFLMPSLPAGHLLTIF